MIKGSSSAACFMDVPFASLKYVLTPENTDPQSPRYEPYGIVVTKRYAYDEGCRPVLYLSNNELDDMRIPKSHLWRVVRFEVSRDGWISWLHEREWRCKAVLNCRRSFRRCSYALRAKQPSLRTRLRPSRNSSASRGQ
jgi:hypothetical protein